MNSRLVWYYYYVAFFSSIASTVVVTVNSLSSSTTPAKKRPRIPILQYHDRWVCVNKPSGITVHRGNGTPKHRAVLTTTVKRQLSRKVFPVHRLDHRTSGAMLFAFDSETAGILHDAAIRKGRKQYIALVRGEWNPNNTYSNKNPNGEKEDDESSSSSSSSSSSEVVFVDKPLEVKGITKEALTKFTLLGTTTGGDGDATSTTTNDRCSLLLCEPLTGRTHQIRRHAFAMGHPIVGDTQHGDNAFNRWWRNHRSLNRLALHCWTIGFEFELDYDDNDDDVTDPTTQTHECVAPLPSKLRAVFEKLPLWEESLAKEPLLALDPVDKVDGTHGRGYQKRKSGDDKPQNR
jgi:tRNA pseudouridine65 synthase